MWCVLFRVYICKNTIFFVFFWKKMKHITQVYVKIFVYFCRMKKDYKLLGIIYKLIKYPVFLKYF